MIGPRYVGETELVWPTGTHAGPDYRPDEVAPVGRDAAWTLSGMQNDFRFFSHAALLSSGLPVDPVALFWAENGLPEKEAPYRLAAPKTVLKGLPPPLDAIVLACPVHHAARLFSFLDRITVQAADRNNELWSAVHQRLPLVDWQMAKSLTHTPPEPPTVDVELYGMEGPPGGFLWWRPEDLWKNPLSLTWQPKPVKPARRPTRGFPRSTTP